ncbi:FAD-dependent oxidoreductase [Massilia sp. 9096]|uniref:FAD-dependent oxidoreductase n=1 Tax=Massilia sp. 9096 TaxID=1500894 RepID=UPI001EFB55F1|nr:FAD-dependent oxidoreductase [Massilia sp. 9096]
MDVLICGAGAAGLTLALELARRGVRLRLIDRMEAPFHGSRGKGIQPRTLEIFEDLGVLDRLAARGGPYPPLREYAGDGSFVDTDVVEAPEPTPAEPFGAPLMLPQFLTEDALRRRLLEFGHRVEYGVTLDSFTQDETGVSVVLSGAQGRTRVRARYLAGADGGRSTVRHLLGIGFPGKTLGVRAMVADVTLEGLSRAAWHRFNEGSMARQVAVCPLLGTDLFQVQAPVPLEGEDGGEVDLSAQGIEALVRARSGRDDIRVHAVSWASAYSMNARLAERYRVGRVFLAGDAAHIHPPTGGQGLNTSVQDAWNLGWKLAAALGMREPGAAERLLDSYEAERRPVAAAMLGLATRLLDAARRGDLRRGRETRQLDIGYPDSPLALERPARADGLLAGQRAPDAPVRGAGGQPVRLFALLQGAHWTLIGRDVAPALLDGLRRPGLRVHGFGPGGDLVDADGHFHAAYGLGPGQLLLVRPDGYIGAFTADSEVEALGAYLRAAGVAPSHWMRDHNS